MRRTGRVKTGRRQRSLGQRRALKGGRHLFPSAGHNSDISLGALGSLSSLKGVFCRLRLSPLRRGRRDGGGIDRTVSRLRGGYIRFDAGQEVKFFTSQVFQYLQSHCVNLEAKRKAGCSEISKCFEIPGAKQAQPAPTRQNRPRIPGRKHLRRRQSQTSSAQQVVRRQAMREQADSAPDRSAREGGILFFIHRYRSLSQRR